MTIYKIAISQPAESDLSDILAYITETLKSPQTAQRIYSAIKCAIMTLNKLPERHNVIDEQPYSAMGVRRLFVANYVVFYIVNNENQTVHILRILYNRREWKHILSKGFYV